MPMEGYGRVEMLVRLSAWPCFPFGTFGSFGYTAVSGLSILFVYSGTRLVLISLSLSAHDMVWHLISLTTYLPISL